MKTNRRNFLQQSALAASTVLLGSANVFASRNASAINNPFARVPLGNTGLTLSRLCMGTGVRGGMRQSNHTRMGLEKFTGLVRGAFERGINTFDLADLYGTHLFFANAMDGIPRDQYHIITKIWFRDGALPEAERPNADVVVERFLKELKTDHIDLVLMHCLTSEDWIQEKEFQMEILARLKKKGVIRAHGISCHSLAALKAAVSEPWVDSVHARINPYGTKMDGPMVEVLPVLQDLHKAGKGIVGMKILGEGEFSQNEEKKRASINLAVNSNCIDIMNVGFEKPEQIDDFANRVRKTES